MNKLCHGVTLICVSACLAIATSAQTPAELRARYGEPQMSELVNNRPVVERYLVRPAILLTMRYTKDGLPCKAVLAPVPGSSLRDGRVEHSPQGDYMATAEVIKLINELVPIAKRGKKHIQGTLNGGDPEMRLNHPGCTGVHFAWFENVSFSCTSWCWGGTFSATINWGKTIVEGKPSRTTTINNCDTTENPVGPKQEEPVPQPAP